MKDGISIRREAAISVAINGLFSAGFFLGVFGFVPRPLNWATPDNLAVDFVPQSIAVALMSALVPALIARRRLGNICSLRPILIRGGLFALAGGILGGLMALSVVALDFPPIGWMAALMMKSIYGGALGALVALMALRRLISSVRPV